MKRYGMLRQAVGIVCISALLLTACAAERRTFPYKSSIGKEVIIQTDVSQSFADKAAKRFTIVYDAYHELVPLATKRERPFVITVLKGRQDFYEYQKQISPTKSDVGFYLSERGELVLRFRGTTNTIRTLYHEAFHAYFEDRVIRPPAWLNEGLAQYVETLHVVLGKPINIGKFHDKWISTLGRVFRRDEVPHLREIIEGDWPDRHALSKEQYALSWSLVYFLKNASEEHEAAFNRYLELLYNKKHPRRAFYEVWPDVDTLDSEWRSFVKRSVLKRRLLKLLPGI